MASGRLLPKSLLNLAVFIWPAEDNCQRGPQRGLQACVQEGLAHRRH